MIEMLPYHDERSLDASVVKFRDPPMIIARTTLPYGIKMERVRQIRSNP